MFDLSSLPSSRTAIEVEEVTPPEPKIIVHFTSRRRRKRERKFQELTIVYL